jgi:type II secretory pathway pseudopilin PulG
MGVVLLIIATVVGGGLVIFTQSLDKQRWELTQSRLQVIQKTLRDYRIAFNRIPCPADATLLSTVTNFGVEAANSTSCTGGTPAANFVDNPADYVNTIDTTLVSSSVFASMRSIAGIFVGSVVSGTGITGGTTITAVSSEDDGLDAAGRLSAVATSSGTESLSYTYDNRFAAGGVPTKTLRLPDEYAFDGWGRRILYAVDTSFTTTDAFISVPVTEVPTPPARITVENLAGDAITTLAAYTLVSYGANGHGAYPRNSTTRFAAPGASAKELINCHCDASGVDDATDYDTFVQGVQSSTFDDMVVYGTRAQLASPAE